MSVVDVFFDSGYHNAARSLPAIAATGLVQGAVSQQSEKIGASGDAPSETAKISMASRRAALQSRRRNQCVGDMPRRAAERVKGYFAGERWLCPYSLACKLGLAHHRSACP